MTLRFTHHYRGPVWIVQEHGGCIIKSWLSAEESHRETSNFLLHFWSAAFWLPYHWWQNWESFLQVDGTSARQPNPNALQPSCALPESVHLQCGCKSYLLLSLVLVHSALACLLWLMALFWLCWLIIHLMSSFGWCKWWICHSSIFLKVAHVSSLLIW